MERPTVSRAEEAEIYAIIRREQAQVDKAIKRMVKNPNGLSDVGQMQALAELLAGWIKNAYPRGSRDGSDAVQHLHEQIGIHLKAGNEPVN